MGYNVIMTLSIYSDFIAKVITLLDPSPQYSSAQDGMGSQRSDQQICPDLGKKCSQAGLRATECRKHRLKCQNVCLGCFSEVFMLQMVPQLHLSSEIQSIYFFRLKIRSNPDLRQSWGPGFVNIISKNTIRSGFPELPWDCLRKSSSKNGKMK